MSNIREIEVNGQTYGLESVNDIYVSFTEPTGAVKPGVWLQPSGYYDVQGTIGLEYKTGSTSSYGDYTLDEQGNLVETTDTSSATGTRCTKLFGLFQNQTYYLENINYGSFTPSSGQLWTWEVYFYDSNKTFISKATGSCEIGVTVNPGYKIIEFTMPEGARYIRIKTPYSRAYYFPLIDSRSTVNPSGGGMYGGSSTMDKTYMLDNDHYVMV